MPFKDPNSEAAKASNKRRQAKYNATEKSKERFKRYRERHPELRRENWYKGEHGITLEAFESQIAKQNNLCPIGNHPFGKRGRDDDSPCQDHNHETDENRGIICRNHNLGIGYFSDSVEELESAISYLKLYKK